MTTIIITLAKGQNDKRNKYIFKRYANGKQTCEVAHKRRELASARETIGRRPSLPAAPPELLPSQPLLPPMGEVDGIMPSKSVELARAALQWKRSDEYSQEREASEKSSYEQHVWRSTVVHVHELVNVREELPLQLRAQ